MFSRIIYSKKTAVAWTLSILILLLLPGGSFHKEGLLGIPHMDKLVHFFLFGVFVVLWYLSLTNGITSTFQNTLAVQLFLVSAIFGTSMEFVQGLFTTREFEVPDILADIAGAGTGWLWLRYGIRKSPYGNRGRNQN
jgi:VanZ family protein